MSEILTSTLFIFLNPEPLGFSPFILVNFLILALLLIASAVISGSETAFFSLKPNDISELDSTDTKQDKMVFELREKPKTLLATILIANNLVNVAIVILSTFITAKLFDLEHNPVLAFVIQIVVVTSLLLLIGEIIPKVIANRHPVRLARLAAFPMNFLVHLFKPISMILVGSTSFLDKKLIRKSYNLSMSELSAAIDITSDETTPPEEKKMLKGIATFNEKEVRSVMKPRIGITALDIKTSFEEVISLILKTGFSRIPVFEGNLDHVIGLLYIKDLIPYLDKSDIDWTTLIRPSFFVPENKRINDLLQEFREKKIHLAIVVDEYGGTAGLISLEDIIEEIVGEISDEFDKDSNNSFYSKLDDQTFLFNASTNLLDFCKVLEFDEHYFDDLQDESDTIAGLILEMEGRIPTKGAKIKIKDLVLEVVDADSRRIKQIKIRKPDAEIN
jgi:gliding motility-associated protein GldE